MHLPSDPEIPLLGTHPIDLPAHANLLPCKVIDCGIICNTTNHKQLKCPVKHTILVYLPLEYYTAIKKKTLRKTTCALIWKDIQNI